MAWEVDDLTEARCADCGTDRELTREPSVVLDGCFYGIVRCEECLDRAEGLVAHRAQGGAVAYGPLTGGV